MSTSFDSSPQHSKKKLGRHVTKEHTRELLKFIVFQTWESRSKTRTLDLKVLLYGFRCGSSRLRPMRRSTWTKNNKTHVIISFRHPVPKAPLKPFFRVCRPFATKALPFLLRTYMFNPLHMWVLAPQRRPSRCCQNLDPTRWTWCTEPRAEARRNEEKQRLEAEKTPHRWSAAKRSVPVDRLETKAAGRGRARPGAEPRSGRRRWRRPPGWVMDEVGAPCFRTRSATVREHMLAFP